MLEYPSICDLTFRGLLPHMAAMCAADRRFAIGLVAIVLLGGCKELPTDPHPDSYVVVAHITDEDRYVIRHNDLEIEAACRNSTFTTNKDRTIHATNCLTLMPVGKEIKVTRGVSGSLYADWNESGIDWQMLLSIQGEELKPGVPPAPLRASVWAITIGTFLGVLVALLLLAFVFSKNRLLREALSEHRREKRVPTSVGLELSRLEIPSLGQSNLYKVRTENTSCHGARAVVKKPWQTGDNVLVHLPRWERPSPARIAYCVGLGEEAFAIGLQFPMAMDWTLPLTEMSPERPTSHAYRK